jgi:glycosyltransferase involved in cell wall biosynthesis
LRIALVGPTHPYKGGVAAHTTETAHRLAAAGHDVDLVSWARLYPKLLYPGEQAVPAGGPDLPPFDRTTAPLRWDRPASWWRAGRALRDHDLVVVVIVVPAQVPALLTLVRSARRGRRCQVVVLAHNVVPHETHPGGEWLMGRLLATADATFVHSAEQGRLAAEHGAARVAVADLPPHLPGGAPGRRQRAEEREAHRGRAQEENAPVRVLALGMVREYKGIDLLLEAAREVPGVLLTVAGEQWGAAGEKVRRLAAEPGLRERVRLRGGYVPGSEVPRLLAEHDMLALTYRHATASQNVLLANAHGLPVLASRVGTFPDQVRDGVDGLLVPPGDRAALVEALRRLTEPGTLEKLTAGVPEVDLDAPWEAYVRTLTSLADRAEPGR